VATVVRRPLAALDILDVWDHIADDDMAQRIAGSTSSTLPSDGSRRSR
jgi:hypothetical protein